MSTVKANTLEPASGGTITITGAALTTPALGTPASGTLTNCTGLPASAVVNTPSGGISATTVQAALNELDTEKFDKAGGTITGAVHAQGRMSSGHATADDNCASFSNTHANSYGLYSRGGYGSRYAAAFYDKDGTNLLLLSGAGAMTVAEGVQASTFQANTGAPGFYIPNQGTNGARAQFVNTGGTFHIGLDSSGGGLGGPYTVSYFYTGAYDQVWATNSAVRWRMGGSDGHLTPSTDNTYDFGSASYAVRQIRTNNSVIVTSDARLKTTRAYTMAERAVAQRIRALGLVYQWNDSIAQKGADRARLHFGTTVQSVIAAFDAEGLDPFRYGVVCYDEWEAQVIEHPAVEAADAVAAQPAVYEELMVDVVIRVNGEDRPAQRPVLVELQPAVPAQPAVQAREAYTETVREAGSRYSLRYEQLNFFIATAGA